MAFLCQQCGLESLKWLGRCPQCGAWNSLTERTPHSANPSQPQELSSLPAESIKRLSLPIKELDRVLGGGLVPGSLVLLGGEPGIGKSTLLLQVADLVASQGGEVVYASGEESVAQIKLRSHRLGLKGERVFALADTDLEAILHHLDKYSPKLAVIDSIQTIYQPQLEGAAGSLSQVREGTLKLMGWAKARGVPLLLTGHVTKDGTIAGPKSLEHIVDVVLYLEGDEHSSYRLLRSVKNRFGSTHEIGVFHMGNTGLMEVENPSSAFLSTHPGEAVGCAVVPVFEGSRPLLVEIQALTAPAVLGPPKRLANGVDFSRLLLLTAVLSQRAGVSLSHQDVVVNVVGGYRISEPATDLAVALAIASSLKGAAVMPHTIVMGEVGLTGEVRPVPWYEKRLTEAQRLGFQHCLAPVAACGIIPGMEVIPVASLRQALRLGLSPKRRVDERE